MSELCSLLSNLPGPVLFIGPVAQAVVSDEATVNLLILDPRTRKKKLSRQAAGLRVVRGDPVFPPLDSESLGGVFVDRQLGRQADGLRAVCAWRDLLCTGGLLMVLEPESTPPIVGAMRRLITGAPAHRPPEAVSALMLNAGLGTVGQQLLKGTHPGVLTRGTKRIQAVARDR